MMFRVLFRLAPIVISLSVLSCGRGSDAGPEGDGGGGGSGGAEGGQGGEESPAGSGGMSALGGAAAGPGGAGGAASGGTAGSGGVAGAPAIGGVGGGGAMGGAAVAGASKCGAFAVCDDFESSVPGPLPSGKWQIEGGDAKSYSITEEQKHSGSRSVKITNEASSPDRMLKISGLDSMVAGGKTVFGRVWMYFPSLPQVSREGAGPHYRLLRFFELGPTGAGAVVSAGIVGSDRGRMLYFRAAGFKDCAKDAATLPSGKWACVELRADVNGYEAWIDGKSMGAANAVAGDECWQKHSKVTSAGFGFQFAAGNLDKPFTFYMDDIALDTQRIGCN
ncbi:MAG: hypothetical protein SF187_28045 [Deltaproteobacteria bacterium]|nr:hypothetical protein [Deltaproteobacteria bacterium]